MPDNRGLAFSSGFNAGAGAITNRRRMDLLEKQNQQEQRELQRKKLDEAFESGIAEIANQVKTLTPVIYSSDGKGKADAEIALRKGRSVIFDDLNKMANIAVDNQYMTPEEANLALQRAALAGKPIDPRPAQDLAARGEQVGEQGKTLGKETAISSDVAQANRDADNARAIKLRQTPTTQNVNEQTVGGADSRPPGGEVFEGIGRSIMDDIRQSSGAFAAASKAISRTGGQAISGTNPRIDSESRVNNFNQEIKAAFTRNPRFPVSELEKISDELLPDPKAIFTDPESEARKIPLLKNHLENLNEVDSRALQGALSKSGRNDTIDRMATRQAVIDLIGNVPDISEQADARTKDLERIGIENMTEQQMDEYLELTK